MNPGHPAYGVDWVFSNTSDVHVASHRDWFKKLTPFNSHLDDGYFRDSGCKVEGIGDVELTVKTHPTRTGAQYQKILELHEVLYAPTAPCNILGMPLAFNCEVMLSFGSSVSKMFDNQSGAVVGLLDLSKSKLFRLRLRNQRSDQTSLDPNTAYVIRADWPDSERNLWETSKQKTHKALISKPTLRLASPEPVKVQDTNPTLTETERKWLKDNFGNEVHFLRTYQLSIYKDEDREEGRGILRAMMGHEKNGGDDEEDNEGGDHSFSRESEEDSMSHAADYHFSADELGWIRENYGNSAHFLHWHGLKFWDDDDCREGKSIVRALMK